MGNDISTVIWSNASEFSLINEVTYCMPELPAEVLLQNRENNNNNNNNINFI